MGKRRLKKMKAGDDEFRCTECDWIGSSWDIIRAPKPVRGEDDIYPVGKGLLYVMICPACKANGTIESVCDEQY